MVSLQGNERSETERQYDTGAQKSKYLIISGYVSLLCIYQYLSFVEILYDSCKIKTGFQNKNYCMSVDIIADVPEFALLVSHPIIPVIVDIS